MTQCLKQFVDYFLKHKDEKLFLIFMYLAAVVLLNFSCNQVIVFVFLPVKEKKESHTCTVDNSVESTARHCELPQSICLWTEVWQPPFRK